MIRFEDFKDAAGTVDWAALRAAQIAAGELCRECGGHVPGSAGLPRRCLACEFLHRSSASETHPSRVRCPHCRHVQAIEDRLEEGGRVVGCQKCERSYAVRVCISRLYESPAVAQAPAAAGDA